MTAHECKKEDIIEAIRVRLGDGDISLATIKMQLDQILAQTTRTNGRVTKLERFSSGVRNTLLGALLFGIAQITGLTGLVMGVMK